MRWHQVSILPVTLRLASNLLTILSSLAYCELFMATAALTLRVFPRMRLLQTTLDDVKYDHDLLTAQPKRGSKGVWVVMH